MPDLRGTLRRGSPAERGNPDAGLLPGASGACDGSVGSWRVLQRQSDDLEHDGDAVRPTACDAWWPLEGALSL